MKWHVWGDYVHTRPNRIGQARLVAGKDELARHTAAACGFDLERRTLNGFEPWAAVFESDGEPEQEFAFADYPTVRGWRCVP
jgi:hypothetical protein